MTFCTAAFMLTPSKMVADKQAVSEYMREIGRKGGQAGKGNPTRRQLNKRAAKLSWSNSARAKRNAKREQGSEVLG